MAGGSGTRLAPTTIGVNKSLLPVYDKPMIYYPISLLMMAGVRDILLVVSPRELDVFRRLLGDGSRFGISLQYVIEEEPLGTIQAFFLGRDFIGAEALALALGDNVFFGRGLDSVMTSAARRFEERGGAHVFCRRVDDPRDFGVIEYGADGEIRSFESKPRHPKSPYAITGLFFFDHETIGLAQDLGHRDDGSFGIPQLLEHCLKSGTLHSTVLDDEIMWFDAGTPRRLLDAASAVQAYQEDAGRYAGSIEQTAFECGAIDAGQLCALSDELSATEYGSYLARLAHGG